MIKHTHHTCSTDCLPIHPSYPGENSSSESVNYSPEQRARVAKFAEEAFEKFGHLIPETEACLPNKREVAAQIALKREMDFASVMYGQSLDAYNKIIKVMRLGTTRAAGCAALADAEMILRNILRLYLEVHEDSNIPEEHM